MSTKTGSEEKPINYGKRFGIGWALGAVVVIALIGGVILDSMLAKVVAEYARCKAIVVESSEKVTEKGTEYRNVWGAIFSCGKLDVFAKRGKGTFASDADWQKLRVGQQIECRMKKAWIMRSLFFTDCRIVG